MREILFRGKDKDTGRWIQGGFHIWEKRMLNPIGVDYLKDDEIAYTITVNSFADWNMPRTMQAVEVIPETVGQYTGLNDKNGTKIFEGDILHIKTGNGWTCPKGTDIYYEVVFTDFNIQCNSTTEYIGFVAKRGKSLSSIYYIIDQYGAEVVGNKYDNPELLGTEKANE